MTQPPFIYSRASDTYMYGGLLWEMFEGEGGEAPWAHVKSRGELAAALRERGEDLVRVH